ncbi:MAG: QueT transporter family protein [Bacilli bacterium]|nr:QueT transporter family protein [Mollicutes bacterium]MDY3899093.1 QueT transporter family protein [Bacilli bacterium]
MNNKRKEQIISITKIAIVAALYIVLTVLIYPLSFNEIQVRFSEVLLLLCFFDKKYGIGIVVGCAVSNLFSPIPLDVLFGTVQTIVAVVLIGYLRPLILSLILTILSMVIVGLEIAVISSFDMWWLITIQVMAGEAIVLLGIVYPLSFLLKRSKSFMKIIKLS